MAYNWEKIFKDKSNMELFNIYKGRTHLSGDAIEFAKKELESRSFDVNNLSSLIESLKGSNYEENLESYKNSARSAIIGVQIGLVFFLVLFVSYFLNSFLGVLEIFTLQTFLFFNFVLFVFIGVEFVLFNIHTNNLKKFISKHENKENEK